MQTPISFLLALSLASGFLSCSLLSPKATKVSRPAVEGPKTEGTMEGPLVEVVRTLRFQDRAQAGLEPANVEEGTGKIVSSYAYDFKVDAVSRFWVGAISERFSECAEASGSLYSLQKRSENRFVEIQQKLLPSFSTVLEAGQYRVHLRLSGKSCASFRSRIGVSLEKEIKLVVPKIEESVAASLANTTLAFYDLDEAPVVSGNAPLRVASFYLDSTSGVVPAGVQFEVVPASKGKVCSGIAFEIKGNSIFASSKGELEEFDCAYDLRARKGAESKTYPFTFVLDLILKKTWDLAGTPNHKYIPVTTLPNDIFVGDSYETATKEIVREYFGSNYHVGWIREASTQVGSSGRMSKERILEFFRLSPSSFSVYRNELRESSAPELERLFAQSPLSESKFLVPLLIYSATSFYTMFDFGEFDGSRYGERPKNPSQFVRQTDFGQNILLLVYVSPTTAVFEKRFASLSNFEAELPKLRGRAQLSLFLLDENGSFGADVLEKFVGGCNGHSPDGCIKSLDKFMEYYNGEFDSQRTFPPLKGSKKDFSVRGYVPLLSLLRPVTDLAIFK